MQSPDTVEPDMTLTEAREEVHEMHDDRVDKVLSDTVVSVLGIRKGQAFYWESSAVPAEHTEAGAKLEAEEVGVLEVTASNNFRPGLEVASPELEPGGGTPIEELLREAYIRLYRDWKRGDVVGVETVFKRADTGEVVE